MGATEVNSFLFKKGRQGLYRRSGAPRRLDASECVQLVFLCVGGGLKNTFWWFLQNHHQGDIFELT